MMADKAPHSEIRFIDYVLMGWAAWARDDGINLKPVSAGDLWKIERIIDAKDYVLVLTDAAFLLVDKSIARLPERLRGIVFLEYGSGLPAAARIRESGLNRLAYRERLAAAQWSLYSVLRPCIDDWRRETVISSPSLMCAR